MCFRRLHIHLETYLVTMQVPYLIINFIDNNKPVAGFTAMANINILVGHITLAVINKIEIMQNLLS
jgi:hypothetical protein